MGRRIQSTAADMEPAEGVPVVVVDGVPVDSLPYRTLSDVDEKLVARPQAGGTGGTWI